MIGANSTHNDLRRGSAAASHRVSSAPLLEAGHRPFLLALRPLVLVLLACCFANAADSTNTIANINQWLVRSWQTKDGLPQNTIHAITQTPDGYLWLGTGGGVARFDGLRFRSYGLPDGLRSLVISTLLVDHQGVLWVGTMGGGVSRWSNGRFIDLPNAQDLQHAEVRSLAAQPDGTLWIGTERGLVRWQNGACQFIGPADGLPQNQVRALLVDSKGTLWVSITPAEGLFQFASGRFLAGPNTNKAPKSAYCLVEDQDGSVWAGSSTGWLYQWRDGVWTRYDQTNGLRSDYLVCAAAGNQRQIWVGSWSSGLFVSHGNGFQKLPSGGPSGLSDDAVRCLFADREGTLWVGTMSGGLNRVSPRMLYHWGVQEGLRSPDVMSVAEDSTGDLWAGTRSEGIWRFHERRFVKLQDPAVSGNYPVSNAALAAEDGSIWVSVNSKLFRFRAGQPTQDLLDKAKPSQLVTAMCADGTNLWLGAVSPGLNSGLLRYDGVSLTTVATNGSFAGRITSLVLEAPETLWLGAADGLHRWERGQRRHWTTRDGLLTDSISALHRDTNGTLWIGTAGGGLGRLKEGRIASITSKQGLIDDAVSQILSDDLGQLWLGCNRGIMRLNKEEVQACMDGKLSAVSGMVFGVNEGMLTEQCSGGCSPTALKTRDGRLLFPTLRGIVEIDPRRFEGMQNQAPPTYIEEVTLDGQVHDPNGPVVISPGQHRLEIRYSAPSLRGADWVRFRQRLDPMDKDWLFVGRTRTATYEDLRPGRYEFQVVASSNSREWNGRTAALAVVAQPWLWQTLWFRMLAALTLCVAAYGAYRQRIARLERRREEQETFTRQLLLSQESERKRIAAELHDGLGQDLLLIKNRLALVTSAAKQSPAIESQLAEIAGNASRAIQEVRTLSHGLRPSALEQVGFTKAVQWMVEQLGEATPVKFSVDLENIDGLLQPDLEINLYRIVQEALNNVLKHAQATQVIVELKRASEGILLSIFDNGRGFDPQRQRELSSSFGLMGMSERAKVLGGSIEVQSAPRKGTRVTVTVPLVFPRRKSESQKLE